MMGKSLDDSARALLLLSARWVSFGARPELSSGFCRCYMYYLYQAMLLQGFR